MAGRESFASWDVVLCAGMLLCAQDAQTTYGMPFTSVGRRLQQRAETWRLCHVCSAAATHHNWRCCVKLGDDLILPMTVPPFSWSPHCAVCSQSLHALARPSCTCAGQHVRPLVAQTGLYGHCDTVYTTLLSTQSHGCQFTHATMAHIFVTAAWRCRKDLHLHLVLHAASYPCTGLEVLCCSLLTSPSHE